MRRLDKILEKNPKILYRASMACLGAGIVLTSAGLLSAFSENENDAIEIMHKDKPKTELSTLDKLRCPYE